MNSSYDEPFAKVILQVVKKSRFFNYSPLSLCPFSPKGAREVVVPQLLPAPSGGRMSEGHGAPARTKYEQGELKGGSSIALDFCKKPHIYPDEFTIYDVRVCDAIGNFHYLNNISRFEKLWAGYRHFLAAVQKEAPEGLSLRDKDRWLWGKSFWEQLDRDVKNEFSINK